MHADGRPVLAVHGLTKRYPGVVALVTWVLFLLLDAGWLGVVSLLAWWVTVVAGLLILARWLPAKGRHSSGPTADTWGEGPGLSILAHVGLLVGVIVFTILFVMGCGAGTPVDPSTIDPADYSLTTDRSAYLAVGEGEGPGRMIEPLPSESRCSSAPSSTYVMISISRCPWVGKPCAGATRSSLITRRSRKPICAGS